MTTSGHRHGRGGRGGATLLRLLFAALHCSLLLLPAARALEASFTPNPADALDAGGDGGPLPASLQQRRQLLELETVIARSDDPAGTLGRVAEQNQLSPDALAGMLDRNRRELRESGQLDGLTAEAEAAVDAAVQGQGGGGGGALGATFPRRLVRVAASVLAALLKTAAVQLRRAPRLSALLGLLLLATLLAVHSAPKNGLVLSNGAFPPFSRGHTTLFAPPVDYLERRAVRSFEGGGWTSSLPAPTEVAAGRTGKGKRSPRTVGGVGMTRTLKLGAAGADEEGAAASRSDVEGFALVTTARRTVRSSEDRKTVKRGKGKKEEADESVSELRLEEAECLCEAMTAIFQERKFSEFVPSDAPSLTFRSFLVASEADDDEEEFTEGAVLALQLLGDFGRHGVQPLCLSYETDTADGAAPARHCVAFHTLAGGHFDGELRFSADARDPTPADGEAAVVVRVALAIPTGGRAPPARLAEALVAALADSVARSARLQRRQALARRRQSRSYRGDARGRATRKRRLRYEQGKAQEEMAAERKRKWRRNPDAGRYTPGSHAARGPKGAPKFS